MLYHRVTNLLLAGACALAFAAPADAGPLKILHRFTSRRDGESPVAALAPDGQGNFYGTTSLGGKKYCHSGSGCGVVFRISPDGSLTTLYMFKAGKDGETPTAGVTLGPDGALYGTTGAGGGSSNCSSGCGTVYRLTLDGQETVVHAFANGSDGATPSGGIVFDAQGNLYGTTFRGGDRSDAGTVYSISPQGTENVLHVFGGKGDGVGPWAKMVFDAAGNLYGTTTKGGAHSQGTVFKLTPQGAETVLYSFGGYPDGGNPESDLTIDGNSNLYGTTPYGGAHNFGTVFKLTPDGVETVLHSFTGAYGDAPDGMYPQAGVIFDPSGNLYGATAGDGVDGYGTIYKLARNGHVKVLHTLSGCFDRKGCIPEGTLASDRLGNLYGTTSLGGAPCDMMGCGTVFRITP